jgi:hypothetical protein
MNGWLTRLLRWARRMVRDPARARTNHEVPNELARDDDVLDAWLDDDGMDASGL